MKPKRSRQSIQREIRTWFAGALCGHGTLLSRSARQRWLRTVKGAGGALALALLAAGCATRQTVLVDTSRDMVLITQPVKAHVAVWQGGQWVENGTMTLPAGWVAGPERKP